MIVVGGSALGHFTLCNGNGNGNGNGVEDESHYHSDDYYESL